MSVTKILVVPVLAAIIAGHANSQCQIQKLVASDAEALDGFGHTVAIDGTWAAIAAPYESDVQPNSGAIYMFQRIGNSWAEAQRLKAPTPELGSLMGTGVALAANVLMVGAPDDDIPNTPQAGSVYVFELVSNSWAQTGRLFASDPGRDDSFGIRLAMTSDRLVVGSPGSGNRGAAYVFDRIGSTWVETAKLTGSDTGPFEGFGLAVGTDGNSVIVGSRHHDDASGLDQGAAYIYEDGPGGWVEVQKLLASDAAATDLFGLTVGIHGARAVVGAPSHTHGLSEVGAAYTYEKVGAVWTQTQELATTDRQVGDGLGAIAVISADHILVTASGDDDNGNLAGSVYDYRWNGSSWVQAGKILARDGFSGDNFGQSIAIQGETVLVGALGDDDACTLDPNCESGSAYIFELAPTANQYGSCPSGSPCGNTDPHGGCSNPTGQGAVMAACGSGSILTDDLRLEVTHCPPNKLTLLFMGPGQQSAVYGNGIRVASAQNPVGIYRYGGAAADSIGRVMRGPGLVAYSQGFQPLGRIQAGQTWNFQFWYRDPNGLCGANTNFSNGVQVAFGP